jgi:acyl-CoA hydrolase
MSEAQGPGAPSTGGLPAKAVSQSAITMSQLMLPSDANPAGSVHGGSILKLVDSAAGVVAVRHCRARVVTARLDEMSFLHPVNIGNLVTLKASVNDTGRTSLEVGVRVEAEDLYTGETWHVGSAYLIFVALDEAGHPTAVPPVLPQTADEVRRQAQARERRARRAQR